MLPGIGFQELIFIGVIALIIVGPKDLPIMMRTLGGYMRKARGLAAEFQGAMNDIARQAELDELRKEVEDLKRMDDLDDAIKDMNEFEKGFNDQIMTENPQSLDPPEDSDDPQSAADTEDDTGAVEDQANKLPESFEDLGIDILPPLDPSEPADVISEPAPAQKPGQNTSPQAPPKPSVKTDAEVSK